MRANDKQKNLNVIEDEAQLTDMGLTDEELDGIRGGRLTGAEEDGGGGIGGDWLINHNETTAKDNATEVELADFGLTDEELDGIKGGREDDGGGGMGGDWVINHNETTVSDEVEAQLSDFGLTDEELDGIKGGKLTGSEDGGGGGMGGDWIVNHNETTVSDEGDEVRFADLTVTDEEAAKVIGGTGQWPVIEPDPGFRWNHNETIAKDNAADIELADVGLTDEELDGIKGGRLTGSEDGGGGGMGGDWVLNHNETILKDTLN
jgi:hypothetical protein